MQTGKKFRFFTLYLGNGFQLSDRCSQYIYIDKETVMFQTVKALRLTLPHHPERHQEFLCTGNCMYVPRVYYVLEIFK